MITYRLKRFSVSGEYVESSESSVKTINNGKVNYKRSRKHRSGETFTTPEGDVVMVNYPEHKSFRKGSYRLKKYSDDGEKKESHFLRNTLIGAGALTAGVMAGRAGMLGASVQKGIGSMTGNIGRMTGSTTLLNDGAKTTAKGQVTKMKNAFATKNPKATSAELEAFNKKAEGMTDKLTNTYKDKYAKTGQWSAENQTAIQQMKDQRAQMKNPVNTTSAPGVNISYTSSTM